MKCPNCGKKIPDNSQVCPGCKTGLNTPTAGLGTFSDPKFGRLLYAGLFVFAILITVFVYLKWQATSIGESYSLNQMAQMYSPETDAAGWFTNGTYIVLCLQLLAMIMWIVTFSKPSPVIPLLAGGVTFVGTLIFIIMAVFGLGAAFEKISDFTRTATAIPYLTLLLSAGEITCAFLSPKLLTLSRAEPPKTGRAGAQNKIVKSGSESTKKLLDELDETVKRDTADKSGAKRSGK